MKINNIIYFCFFILLVYFFTVFETNFNGPDEPIYYSYTESIAEDGDFNVINNIEFNQDDDYRGSQGLNVSKTYNYPDFHNHGAVILWVPFYFYGKFSYFFVEKYNLSKLFSLKDFTKGILSFSTLIFGFFTLILTYKFCRIFFSNRLSFFSTIAICFGTPFFYYLLFEPGNAQIISVFFSIISLWAISYVIKMKKWHWFVYGLFFGICIIVKADLWFQIFFIIFIFLTLFLLKKTKGINGLFFLLGFFPPFLLKTVNDFIKYGTFHIGEIGVLNFKNSYFLEMLFSSYRGYFYTSPILYICLLGFIITIIKFLKNFKNSGNVKKLNNYKNKDFFILILSLYLLIKIIIISYNYAWAGGTTGARILLTEFPIFVILYAYVQKTQQKKIIKTIFGFLSIFFVFWNLFIISEYVANVDLGYVFFTPKWGTRINSFNSILTLLFEYRDLGLKLTLCFLPILVVLMFAFYLAGFQRDIPTSFWYDRKHNSKSVFTIFFLFTIFLNITYGYMTFLNIYNNKNNVEKMKKNNFFKGAKILSINEFEKRENIGAMNEMIEYFTLKGDYERVRRIEKQKEKMYSKIKSWKILQTD